jgi:arsenate reductase
MADANDVPRVLFLCTGNSCRSQMAEGWLRHLAGGRVVALSAGTDPVGIHPRAVQVMAEAGVDLSGHTSDRVAELMRDPPELVIAVCDRAARHCGELPGVRATLCWPFPDPAGATGSEDEVLEEFRSVRDSIGERIRRWLAGGAAPLALER